MEGRASHLLWDPINHWGPITDRSSYNPLLIFKGLSDTLGTEVERLIQNHFLGLVVIATRKKKKMASVSALTVARTICLLFLETRAVQAFLTSPILPASPCGFLPINLWLGVLTLHIHRRATPLGQTMAELGLKEEGFWQFQHLPKERPCD